MAAVEPEELTELPEDLLASMTDHELSVWNAGTGQKLATLTPGGESLAFSPLDPSLLAATSDRTVRLIRFSPKPIVERECSHRAHVSCTAFAYHTADLLAAAAGFQVWLWNVSDSSQPLRILEHDGKVEGIAFSPHDQLLASVLDNTVYLWNSTTGDRCKQLRTGAEGHCVAFSPRMPDLFAVGTGKRAEVWSISAETCVRTEEHRNHVIGVVFSPSEDVVITACWDWKLRVFRTESAELIHSYEGHSLYLRGVAVSSCGGLLASASGDNTVRLWDSDRSKPKGHLLTLEGPDRVNCVAFKPKEDILVKSAV